ncbi:RNA polymerase II-associated protein [Salix suchowensis]|nr:RNA polymerase II-associated protein [Salix suchowensis]
MARTPGKHGRDQALDFQGFLNDLQDWELLKDTDKKMKKKSKGKTSGADSSRSGSGQYDYSRNFGAINHLSSSFTTDEVSVDATSEKELGNESIALSPTAVAHANRAMAYLKIKRQAEDYCTEALNLDDHYKKGYSRRATARKELGKLKESIKGENDGNYLVKKSVYVKELRNKGTGAGSKSDGQVGNDSPANATPSSNVESVQKNNRTRRQELKTSVIELASQAASRAMAEAAKNITPPNSAYQFEVSWRGFSGDRALQTHLLKVTSPSALPQIFKNALSVPILIDIIKCVASFFIDDMDLAVKYLDNLTKVPRFDVLWMFNFFGWHLGVSDCAHDLLKMWDGVFCSASTPIEYAEILDTLWSKYRPKC